MAIDKDYIDSITEEATVFSLIYVITIPWLFSGKWFKMSHFKLKKNFHYLKMWIKPYQYRKCHLWSKEHDALPVKKKFLSSYSPLFYCVFILQKTVVARAN